jgi:hypothetical protein
MRYLFLILFFHSFQQTASEIRRLSKVVNFKSSELIQQKFEHFVARTKKATFNIDGISFEYCNTAPNINQTSVDTTTVMRVLGKPESNLNGNLWELVDGQRYVFSRALMHHIKKQLDIKMTDSRLTKFLLCIGEVESGGSWGLVESELEAMAAFFTPEGDIAEVSHISVPSASLSMDMTDD